MPMGGKPLAALIVGRKLPAGGKASPAPAAAAPSDAGPDGQALDVAQALIDAITAKDPHATAAALQAACALGSGESDHAEPDGDEGLPPAA